MRDRSILARCMPPGYPFRKELAVFLGILVFAVIYTLPGWREYMIQYGEFEQIQMSEYETFEQTQWEPSPGDVHMEEYREIFGGRFIGFWLLICSTLLAAWPRYLYFYSGSRSIYLMWRLPRREIPARCLLFPVCMAVAAATLMALFVLVYFMIYCAATPEMYLVPGQWRNFWEVLI